VTTPKKKILFIVNNLSGTVSQYNIPKCIDMFLDTDIYDANLLFIDAQMTEELYDAKLGENWGHDSICRRRWNLTRARSATD
jgi:hypothetical protein